MSFKLKLVFYFLLVSVLPLGAAGWALHSIERSSETRRVDVRLEAGLRAVLATYKGQVAAADHRAHVLAADRELRLSGSRAARRDGDDDDRRQSGVMRLRGALGRRRRKRRRVNDRARGARGKRGRLRCRVRPQRHERG